LGDLLALKHFFVSAETGCDTSVWGRDIELLRPDGRRVGTLFGVREGVQGIDGSWSTDGRWLLVTISYGGTRPPPSRFYAYSVETGRASLVARAVLGAAPFAGPGGWAVWAGAETGPSYSAALMLGQLSGG
jgi:hypothetical protein